MAASTAARVWSVSGAAGSISAKEVTAVGAEGCGARFRSSLGFARVGLKKVQAGGGRSLGPQNGSRVNAWFKFGKNGLDSEGAGIYGSQARDDFDRDDVEQVLLTAPCPRFISGLDFTDEMISGPVVPCHCSFPSSCLRGFPRSFNDD